MNADATRPSVVIGAGYAGVMAANRLQASGAAQVVMISPDEAFVERIRLHQLAVGTSSATVPFERILHPDIDRVTATAVRIDAADRRVLIADGATYPYELLVYAVGSTSDTPDVPGAREFAHPLAGLADGTRLAERLSRAPADASIVVVGGGLTGVEVAAEMAQARPSASVTIVTAGAVAASTGRRGRASVVRRLHAIGVDFVENSSVVEVSASTVTFADGRVISADITVWTAGFAVPDLARRSGLCTDALGRLRVDERLISVDDPHIVGAGDAIAVTDTPLRMSCQAAMPLGAQAADTVRALLSGGSPAPVDQGFAAQCLSLGRSAGTVVVTDRDDRPRPIVISGRAGGLVKEQVCRMTLRWMARERTRPGSYTWRSASGS